MRLLKQGSPSASVSQQPWEGRTGTPRHTGSCGWMGLAKHKEDQGWTCWANREGYSHLWAWRGLEGWDDGVVARGVGMEALGAWWREFGEFKPWSRRGKDWRGCGSRIAGVPEDSTTWALVTMPHASRQGSPKLGLLQLLCSTDGAGSPASPGPDASTRRL